MKTRLQLVLALGGLFTASSALADDPKFEFASAGDVKDVKDVEWKANAEFGLVFTTGNSETTTITGGAKAERKEGDNKFSAELSGAFAQSGVRQLNDQNGNGLIDSSGEIDTVTTTSSRNLTGKLRYDRFLTEFNSLFAAALASTDQPAGKDLVLGGQLGYSRQIYKSATHELVGEGGVDFSREDLISGDPLSIFSSRFFVGYKGALTTGTAVDGSVELLSNLNSLDTPTGKAGFAKDTRINAKFGVTAKLTASLSINTGIEFKFDNKPAPLKIDKLAPTYVPEATKLDTIMKASLIYSFF
jgi:putative salt-induced outer membrane protein YdiY